MSEGFEAAMFRYLQVISVDAYVSSFKYDAGLQPRATAAGRAGRKTATASRGNAPI
jgi:hypothetical protein